MILRYYTVSYFYTHFWNENLWKKFFDKKIISKANFHKDPACFFRKLSYNMSNLLATKIIFTKDLAKVTKFISKLQGLIKNTRRWLTRLCHIYRFDSQKQQILFSSSAKKFYLEENRERKGKMDSRVHSDSLGNI